MRVRFFKNGSKCLNQNVATHLMAQLEGAVILCSNHHVLFLAILHHDSGSFNSENESEYAQNGTMATQCSYNETSGVSIGIQVMVENVIGLLKMGFHCLCQAEGKGREGDPIVHAEFLWSAV